MINIAFLMMLVIYLGLLGAAISLLVSCSQVGGTKITAIMLIIIIVVLVAVITLIGLRLFIV